MIPVSLTELANRCSGKVLGTVLGTDILLTGATTDSRSVNRGDLFVAIPGERVDGHRFVTGAFEQGAAAALVEHNTDAVGPQVLVESTVAAFGCLGGLVRERFDGTVIGITGSAGKTTAKNLIAKVMANLGSVQATQGNFNNEVGVPITLCQLDDETDIAVVEMGAGKPDDIAYLQQFVRPDVAVLLNASAAHLEHFASVDAIALTKGQILDDLAESSVAVITADSPYTQVWVERASPARVMTFGFGERANVRVTAYESRGFSGSHATINVDGVEAELSLALPGKQGLMNALAALAVGTALGVSVNAMIKSLSEVTPAAGRGAVITTATGARLVDDCYNANPMAMKAAIDVLAAEKGRRHLVMGSMLELGPDAEAMHADIGSYAKSQGIDALWAIGPLAARATEAFGAGAQSFTDREAFLGALPEFGQRDAILVKASRGAALESVVSAIKENAAC